MRSLPEKIVVATGNKGKLQEIKTILKDLPCNLLSLQEIFKEIPKIEETGTTFRENALLKADWTFKNTGLSSLADDSGLMVDALNGAPGVISAHFAGVHGNDKANNLKLLKLLENIPLEKRSAKFVCVLILRIDQNTIIEAEGYCKGKIVDIPRGNRGFGYDPLFLPDGYTQTFGEMSEEEKNLISHRARALRKLVEKLSEYVKQ
ncbi:MAG: XTP/dITP diphosphatase [Chitinispirillaceae bacterium]|nr:XTP/dITP diphosphatase [Chitinispirillaceae bacterium]